MIDQANTQQKQVQNDINKNEAQLRGLQDILGHFRQFKVDNTALETRVSQAVDAAEVHRQASLNIGNQTISTWGSVKATAHSAAAAGWALNKVQYANAILETLDNARFEKSIKTDAIKMLKP